VDAELEEENCHRVERAYGNFTRSFSLPPTVDSGKVSEASVLSCRSPAVTLP
jgi:HSP20 family molecular chaperone IbpA